jgi:catecholate siderophore receptor
MRSLPLIRPLAAALAMAFAAPAAFAAPGTDAGTGDEASPSATTAVAPLAAVAATELDAVEVTGERLPQPTSPKMTQPLLETPQTVTIVPAEMMRQQGVTTLREALGNVPGISLQAGEGGVPAGDNLTLRGFSARTDLFVDGVRDFGGYARDPFNIEQIEVVKGPSSTHTGRGSTGGSINLASKIARQDEEFSAGTLAFGSADLWRLSADLNQPIGDAALRVNLMAHDGGIAGRDAVENERWGVAPTLRFDVGAATVDLSLVHLEQDNVPDYGHPWVPGTSNALPESRDDRAPVDRENYYGLLDRDYEDTQTDMATAIVNLPIGANWSLRNLTRWGEAARDSIITAPRFLSDNATELRRTAKLRDSEDTILANVTDFTGRFGDGDVRHTVVAGVEFATEKSTNDARAATDGDLADLFDPDYDAPYTGVITDTPIMDSRAEADSLAAYVFDTMEIGEHWELSGGLRWDRFDVETEGYDSVALIRREWARDDTMLSGRAALLYKPSDTSSYYVAVGNSFNPSAEGLALNVDTAGLEPEKSRTLEFGGKWALLDERLLLTSAVFRTEKTNARTTDADAIVVLEGEQRVDGFEIGATGEIGDDWTVFAGYTFLDGDVVHSLNPLEDGNELSNTPKHSASLWTTWDATDRLQFGFGARHVGARWTSTQNLRQAKSYTTYDAMASYVLHPSTTLRLNGYNLSDKDYVETVGGGHYGPGAARSFMASLDFSF